MRLASLTKLITTIMALQCVERGLVGLDDDVDRWIPELSRSKVLAGFDDVGNAIMRDRKGVVTLRFETHGLYMSPQVTFSFINFTLC